VVGFGDMHLVNSLERSTTLTTPDLPAALSGSPAWTTHFVIASQLTAAGVSRQ
jgi:hypothetical protein